MTLKKSPDGSGHLIALDKSEKVCFVRPAADVLFDSVAKCVEGDIAAVVLTGMGNDGAEGSKAIKAVGGKIIIQDEESSVVWGMPRAVYQTGCFDQMSSPEEVIRSLNKLGKK